MTEGFLDCCRPFGVAVTPRTVQMPPPPQQRGDPKRDPSEQQTNSNQSIQLRNLLGYEFCGAMTCTPEFLHDDGQFALHSAPPRRVAQQLSCDRGDAFWLGAVLDELRYDFASGNDIR